MFRDLKKGFQVYTLDTSDIPVFRMGNVVNVSEPRFQQPQMGQMGQYQQLQDRVIDLTVEINGSSMTYVVPESRDVAMSNNITLACSVDPIMNQLNAAKRTSSDILDSKGWFGEREIRDEYDSMDPYMRRGRRGRYY